MCGLFGAIGPSIDAELVLFLADLASRRGPHGWGVTIQGEDGVLVASRFRGAFDKRRLSMLLTNLRLPIIVGHCRLATSGDPSDLASYQPIVSDSFTVAHNGTVRNYAELISAYGLQPATECDSEVIALLAERAAADGHTTPVWWALDRLSEDSPYAVVAFGADRLWAARQSGGVGPAGRLPGHPLYYLEDGRTVYVCSRRPADDWCELPDDSFAQWSLIPCPSTS